MKQKTIILEYPNITLKNIPKNIGNIFSENICAVAVNYWVYDKRRKTIVDRGSNRACGCNYTKSSIHAEQIAINFCRNNKHRSLQIYIWRWDKKGNIKPTYCCHSCTKIINKYNYQNDIFTCKDNKVVLATGSPYMPLAYKIKYGLKN